MMDAVCQPLSPEREREAQDRGDRNERPRYWQERTRRNYWAHLDARDVAPFPAPKPLPYLRESRLFEQAQQGDTEARRTVWQQHLRLALSAVNRFYFPQSLVADAVQEAAIGLVPAIQRFEVHRYHAFSTYAWHWVAQRLKRFQINQQYGARIPAYLHPAYVRFRKGLRRCRSRADWFDWRDEWLSSAPDTFERLSRYHRLAHARPIDDASGVTTEDGNPAGTVEHEEILALVIKMVNHLPDRERYIVMRRYGLDGKPEAILQEIGDAIGLTRERVRQLEVETLTGIRRELEMRLTGRNGKSMENRPRLL